MGMGMGMGNTAGAGAGGVADGGLANTLEPETGTGITSGTCAVGKGALLIGPVAGGGARRGGGGVGARPPAGTVRTAADGADTAAAGTRGNPVGARAGRTCGSGVLVFVGAVGQGKPAAR